jgi:DNA-binding response OmpR family regulator
MPGSVPPKTVLIIEDDRDFADTLATLLKLYGHKPVVCYDGMTGIRLAERHRPDVVMLDLALPRLDGFEIARTLRHDAIFNDTVLVAVTGHASDEHRQRAHELGFDLHCRKPIDLGDLRQILKHKRNASPDAALTEADS